jgi:hypothetical protein
VVHLSRWGLNLMGTVRLRFSVSEKPAGVMSLNVFGLAGAQAYELPTTGVSASMFPCDPHGESWVVAVLLSLDRLESSSVYLSPSLPVRSRSMNRSSQFSPAYPIRARPSVVAKLPLLYWFGVTGYSTAWSESLYPSFVVVPKPVKPSSQRSVATELPLLYQSRMSK